jgi:hypothetical protein
MGLIILNSLKNPLLGERIDRMQPTALQTVMLPAQGQHAIISTAEQAMDGL